MSGDDRSWVDRDKKTFSELDRQRRERTTPEERRPRSKVAQERAREATKQYLKEIDGLFSKSRRTEIERLVTAMRNAHGTPGLTDACRAYHEAVGPPAEASVISLFLDTSEPELILLGLEALRAGHEGGRVKVTSSLRSQLRILAEDANDAVAEASEELLEIL